MSGENTQIWLILRHCNRDQACVQSRQYESAYPQNQKSSHISSNKGALALRKLVPRFIASYHSAAHHNIHHIYVNIHYTKTLLQRMRFISSAALFPRNSVHSFQPLSRFMTRCNSTTGNSVLTHFVVHMIIAVWWLGAISSYGSCFIANAWDMKNFSISS